MEELNGKWQDPANDELTDSIVARLAERQRKIERIQEMEKPVQVIRFPRHIVAFAAAACIAALMVFAPWQGASLVDELGITPDVTEYRGASPEMTEIQRLLGEHDYAAALAKTKEALHGSDMELMRLEEESEKNDDESLVYEEQLEHTMNSELRWTYIYLLVKARKNEEAIRELDIYIKDKEYCGHPNEAGQLLESLRKKKK